MKNKIVKMPAASRENAEVLSRIDRLKDQRKSWVQIVRIIAEEGYHRAGGLPYTVFNLATLYSEYKSLNR